MNCSHSIKTIGGAEYQCDREAIAGRELCIMHEALEHKNADETMKELLSEIEQGKREFKGSILPYINLGGREITGNIDFSYSIIQGDAVFEGTKIEGAVWFDRATIEGDASFKEAKIAGTASFMGATIGGRASFMGTIIGGQISFMGAKIGGRTSFIGAKIGGDASFWTTEIKGDAVFEGAEIRGSAQFMSVEIEGHTSFWGTKIGRDAVFWRAKIRGDASFNGTEIKGDATFERARLDGKVSFNRFDAYSLTFPGAKFRLPKSQEEACREAKIVQERRGSRELADQYFYREMEAKRKQKRFWARWLELPLQYLFGYGVHPKRIIASWFFVVGALALLYWSGNGIEEARTLWEYLYFSVVTSATPGYGGYEPVPGIYQNVATAQAIFGTFMWAAFIATFARKFMR